MENRINFRAVTIIFGVIVALVILFSVWYVTPEPSPTAIQTPIEPFSWSLNVKEISRLVLQ